MNKATVWTHSQFQPPALAVLDPIAHVVTSRPASLETWYEEVAAYAALIVGAAQVFDGPVLGGSPNRLLYTLGR